MKGFIVKGIDRKGHALNIRFKYYKKEAPVTVEAFQAQLPFKKEFLHARVSGFEIWTDEAPELDIIQENASVFTKPGEVVIGPKYPKRSKTSKSMGIYYDQGKGFDAANIFAKVVDEDLKNLVELGKTIWKKGAQLLSFEPYED